MNHPEFAIPPLHREVAAVTERIRARSQHTRHDYLGRMGSARSGGAARARLGCTNLAHGFAAAGEGDKQALRGLTWPNIAIVSAYNDMLSAHQPLERFPALIKQAAREVGAVAQFAGGVPAMCDGVTQGLPGMELSLFSRDVIALATAVALSHDLFDAALCLGVCDKIVPGLLIGALSFGHLPASSSPAGPMPSGISNEEKARMRQLYAQGKVGREALLESEAGSYHCARHLHLLRHRQQQPDADGGHGPAPARQRLRQPPNTPLRDALTAPRPSASRAITALGSDYRPLARDRGRAGRRQAIVGLLATGGSTNHTIHLVAIARAAGVLIDWDDFSDALRVVPLLRPHLSERQRPT